MQRKDDQSMPRILSINLWMTLTSRLVHSSRNFEGNSSNDRTSITLRDFPITFRVNAGISRLC